jgi:hypothetical protein
MRYLTNAFSLGMLPSPVDCMFAAKEVSAAEVKFETSAVGHKATADVLKTLLGREVAFNRTAVTLKPGDIVYVAQLQWPAGHPPEGAVVVNPDNLPPVKFMRVIVLDRLGYSPVVA